MIGGKLSRCSSYSGSSNSPIGRKFLIGISSTSSRRREVTTIDFTPAAMPAAVILRIVFATPFTSSSVSVNQARFRFCSTGGMAPVILEKISRNQRRDGAWLWNA